MTPLQPGARGRSLQSGRDRHSSERQAAAGGHARAAEDEDAPQSGRRPGRAGHPGSAGRKSRAREEMGQGRNFKAPGQGPHGDRREWKREEWPGRGDKDPAALM